jgi:quinol monooxygenase YgiN
LWALLPLQARHALGLGSFGYGILLGCIGTGAVAGAAFLPKVRQKVSNNLLVIGATVLFAGVTTVLAHVHVPAAAGAAMVLGGIAWIAVMSSFNTAAQTAAPEWARGRALSIYTLVFMGGMAVGSAVWGAVAARFGVTTALTCAALGLIIGIAASLRHTLIDGDDLNLAPCMCWPEPIVVVKPEPEQGPVLVQIEYRIDPDQAREFRQAMGDLRRIRRRDGASRWTLYRDPAEPSRFVESFLIETWAEHLRQHARATRSDREIEGRIRKFHIGSKPPAITHLIAEHVG